jgi:hypothetical protein
MATYHVTIELRNSEIVHGPFVRKERSDICTGVQTISEWRETAASRMAMYETATSRAECSAAIKFGGFWK